MSLAATIWAWKQPVRSPTCRLILVALADQCRNDTGEMFLSQKAMVAMTGLSERGVRKGLDELEEDGFIARRKAKKGDGRCDDITLVLTEVVIFAGRKIPARGAAIVENTGTGCRQIPARGAAHLINTPVEGSLEPSTVAEDDPFEALWKATPDKMRRRSESREKTRKVWMDALKRLSPNHIPPDALILEAMKRFTKESPDLARTGGPGLHIWLKAGTYEHYLPDEVNAAADAKATFEGPLDLRHAAEMLVGDDKVASYLDPCRWDNDKRVILARTAFAADWIKNNLRGILRSHSASVSVIPR